MDRFATERAGLPLQPALPQVHLKSAMVIDNAMGKIKGVIEDAERQRLKYRESGSWLNDSIPYNQDHYLDEENKTLAQKLLSDLKIKGGYKAEQKQKDFEILLANLFDQKRKPVSISLKQMDWKLSRYNKSSYFTVTLISQLKKNNYINMERGYYNIKDEPSRLTRIWATKKLLSYFPEHPSMVLSKPTELVILHDEKGKPIDYKDTAETWRIREVLRRLNEVNGEADIRYQDFKLYAYLVAIFKERFTWYGRLHTKGFRHYQGFNEDERKDITINGESTVELDYSGLHPNLLYAAEGIQYSGDPYSIVDERSEVRPFLKHILLCMLNAKDKVNAERAANRWLYLHPRESKIFAATDITRARPLMDKFIEAHKPISHYFCKGKVTGMRIMNKDSKIALDIVNYFAKKKIPILCVHDSFLVQKQYKDELHQVMADTYHKHTGFSIKIK